MCNFDFGIQYYVVVSDAARVRNVTIFLPSSYSTVSGSTILYAHIGKIHKRFIRNGYVNLSVSDVPGSHSFFENWPKIARLVLYEELENVKNAGLRGLPVPLSTRNSFSE